MTSIEDFDNIQAGIDNRKPILDVLNFHKLPVRGYDVFDKFVLTTNNDIVYIPGGFCYPGTNNFDLQTYASLPVNFHTLVGTLELARNFFEVFKYVLEFRMKIVVSPEIDNYVENALLNEYKKFGERPMPVYDLPDPFDKIERDNKTKAERISQLEAEVFQLRKKLSEIADTANPQNEESECSDADEIFVKGALSRKHAIIFFNALLELNGTDYGNVRKESVYDLVCQFTNYGRQKIKKDYPGIYKNNDEHQEIAREVYNAIKDLLPKVADHLNANYDLEYEKLCTPTK